MLSSYSLRLSFLLPLNFYLPFSVFSSSSALSPFSFNLLLDSFSASPFSFLPRYPVCVHPASPIFTSHLFLSSAVPPSPSYLLLPTSILTQTFPFPLLLLFFYPSPFFPYSINSSSLHSPGHSSSLGLSSSPLLRCLPHPLTLNTHFHFPILVLNFIFYL